MTRAHLSLEALVLGLEGLDEGLGGVDVDFGLVLDLSSR